MIWQKKARLVITIGAVGFAVALAFAFRPRAPEPDAAPVTPTDPKALVETTGARTLRHNRDREEVLIEHEKLLTYSDGTAKMLGVKVTTERAGGRTFTLTAKEGQFGENESHYTMSGDVQLAASDGLQVRTERATYAENEGIVRAPGPVQFSRGRMRGTGVGFTYDKNRDAASILSDVVIHFAADRSGTGAADMTAGFAELNRAGNTVRLEGAVKTTRGGETTESDTALAHLTEADDVLQRLEMRGHSRLTGSGRGAGAVQSLSGSDINLQYASDGTTIQQALIVGDAVVQLAADRTAKPQPAARQITAQQLDVTLGPDGATPTALTATTNVRVTLPGEAGGRGRTIRAQTLTAAGEPPRGLTRANFSGGVRLCELGAGGANQRRPTAAGAQPGSVLADCIADGTGDVDRAVRAGVLDAALAPGFGGIDDATFRRAVRFEDGEMVATAAEARYMLAKGTLDLSGSEPGAAAPRMVNSRLAIDAVKIRVGFEGPQVAASGSVRSTLQPQNGAGRAGGAGSAGVTGQAGKAGEAGRAGGSLARGAGEATEDGGAKLPAMLKEEQPVHVTANELAYDGSASRATYTGAARLSQGDTSIKADTIVLDDKTGDLTASGSVGTATVLLQDSKRNAKEKERVNTIASAKEFRYEEALRRGTYTGEAHVSGPQGDMTAARIELYLKPSGDELERVEAYDGVTLREQNRTTTGARMTYFSADERYLVSGVPLKVIDECGRETTGRTLTFFKTTDRIVIDGSEQTRTHTKGGSGCR
jgi:LPS export ABC transporter protein LptC/lipopolysaccharide transport protein LptA